MPLILAAGAIALLLTLWLLRRTARCTQRGRVLGASANGIGCLLSVALLSACLVLIVSYYGYQRLTAEQDIARIAFTRLPSSEYRARLMIDGESDRFFVLTGDEWQIDARIVSWQPPATILGLEPLFRLDRLSGRYTDVNDERSEPRSAHALSEPPLLDLWTVARRLPVLAPGVDAYYGTATYLPMADGALFAVSLSRDALVARPANPAAEEAVAGWQ